MKNWQQKAMIVNLSIFSNHHTIIDGCTAPVSDAGHFVVELAGVFLYYYVVLYQDPSGNEACAITNTVSLFRKPREGKKLRIKHYYEIVSPRILELSNY